MNKNILLIFGGRSGEHEVSCVSAAFIEKNLLKAGYTVVPVYIDQQSIWYNPPSVHKKAGENKSNPCQLDFEGGRPKIRGTFIDFAFPIIHGTTGEDGALQGLFETYGIPYAGCGVASSAICMDKFYMREIFSKAGLVQVKYIRLNAFDNQNIESHLQNIESSFSYPVFTKPCNMGSSVGVNRAVDFASLKRAVADSFLYDESILIEQGLSVREVEVGIVGNYPNYAVSCAGEIIPSHEFYSYEAKYVDPDGAHLVIPADLTLEQQGQLKEIAIKAFRAIGGDGFARVDFFIDKQSGQLFLNEINTLPGFTPISMFPSLFAATGLEGPDLVKRIVQLGFARHERRQNLRHSYAT